MITSHLAWTMPWLLLLASGCTAARSAERYPVETDAGQTAGKRAYRKCYSCHSLEGPDSSTQGPSLKGIVGRPVAAEPGFSYSRAMKAYAGRQPVWTAEALEAFIADPQALVPGNDMGFFGIADPQERAQLIAYIESAD